jgi:hypothetical protein
MHHALPHRKAIEGSSAGPRSYASTIVTKVHMHEVYVVVERLTGLALGDHAVARGTC